MEQYPHPAGKTSKFSRGITGIPHKSSVKDSAWTLSLFLLFFIFIFGLLLRVVNLNSIPLGFTPDEAAFGYNAYSLIFTGHDEWKTPFFTLPYSGLLSFGDDKSPLYAGLAIPSVFFLGLTHEATRLPNALLSSLSIPVMYLLVKKLLAKSVFYVQSTIIALMGAMFLAFSTWSVQLSRGAFEAQLVLLFLPLSLVCLLSRRPVFAALFAALSMYSYHTGKFLSPILFFLLFLFHLRFIRPNHFFSRFLPVLLLLVLPLIHSTFTSPNRRILDISILSPSDNWASVVSARYQKTLAGVPDPLARLIHNRPFSVVTQFASNYASYFTPQFLLFSGPKETTYGMLPGWGVLSPVLFLGVLYGLFLLYRFDRRLFAFSIFTLAVSPILSALTKGPGLAANRAAFLLFPLLFIGSLGLGYLVSTRYRHLVLISLFISLFITSLAHVSYFTTGQSIIAPGMLYGYREIFNYSQNYISSSSQTMISRSLSEPHIFYAFYSHTPPPKYQQAAAQWRIFTQLGFSFLDQMDGYRLGNVVFGSIPSKFTQPTFIISRPSELPPAATLIRSVSYPSGEPSVVAGNIHP